MACDVPFPWWTWRWFYAWNAAGERVMDHGPRWMARSDATDMAVGLWSMYPQVLMFTWCGSDRGWEPTAYGS